MSRSPKSLSVEASRQAAGSWPRSSMARCSHAVCSVATACWKASAAAWPALSRWARSIRVDWWAAFHHRSRALPRSASSTTKPCRASWRRWYDVAPVLRSSRRASVVAVAGPSVLSRASIRSRAGCVRALSAAGEGVIEVRSMAAA